MTKNKLCRRINEGETREGSELRGERTEIAEVRRKILAIKDVPIEDDVTDADTDLCILKENKKNQMTFCERQHAQNTSRKFVAIQNTKEI